MKKQHKNILAVFTVLIAVTGIAFAFNTNLFKGQSTVPQDFFMGEGIVSGRGGDEGNIDVGGGEEVDDGMPGDEGAVDDGDPVTGGTGGDEGNIDVDGGEGVDDGSDDSNLSETVAVPEEVAVSNGNNCPDDSYEPNDSSVNAYDLDLSSITARLCEDDADYFVTTENIDGDILTVAIAYNSGARFELAAYLDAPDRSLYRAAWKDLTNLLDYEVSNTGGVLTYTFDISEQEAQQYLFRISGEGFASDTTAVSYALAYQVETLVAATDDVTTGDGTTTEQNSSVFDLASYYADVDSSDDYATAVAYLTEMGVVNGSVNADGVPIYEPGNSLNRAALVKLFGEVETDESALVDAWVLADGVVQPADLDDASDWYYPWVQYAYLREWVNGYADGSFQPTNNVTLEEALKIMINALGADVYLVEEVESSAFSDVKLYAWYAPYVELAERWGIVDTTQSTVGIGQPLLRSDVAEYLFRMMVVMGTDVQASYSIEARDAFLESEGFGS